MPRVFVNNNGAEKTTFTFNFSFLFLLGDLILFVYFKERYETYGYTEYGNVHV